MKSTLRRNRRIDAYTALLVAGAALSFALGIGAKSFWVDEANVVALSRMPFQTLIEPLLTREPTQILYAALLDVWQKLAGQSDAVVRGMSALFGVAAAGVTVTIARRWLSMRAAVLAGLFVALNSMFVQYSQEARPYTLAALGIAVSAGCLLEATRSNAWGWWIGAGAGALIAWYAHPVSVAVLLAPVAGLLATRPPLAWRRSALTAVAVALLAIPNVLLMQKIGKSAIAWITPPGWQHLRDTYRFLIGGSQSWWPIIFIALCVVAALAAAGRNEGRSDPERRRTVIVFVAWGVLPPLILYVGSALQPLYVNRYLLAAVPGMALAIAATIDRLPRNALSTGLAAVIVFALLAGRVELYHTESKEDWRTAAAMVSAEFQAGDRVVFTHPFWRTGFNHYARHSRRDLSGLVPLAPDTPWGIDRIHVSNYPPWKDPKAFAERAAGSYQRIWVLGPKQGINPVWLKPLMRRYGEVYSRSLPGIFVAVYEKRPAGSVPRPGFDLNPISP